jgi:precorrin-6A/cobalt-precorrin-6A reductase
VKVLVLGGTAEAASLAAALHDRPGYAVTSSLAGRVALPSLPPGEVRIGGFGGPDALAGWLQAHGTDVVVDATHPFADQITENAVQAAKATGVRLVVLRRPGWTEGRGDHWHRVPDAPAAATLLPSLGRRVFLPIGRGELAAFAHLDELWFLVRTVERPHPPLPARHQLVISRGPFTADAERSLLREHRIDVVVSRDSGGAMTKAKLVAARELGLAVVLIERPAPPSVETVETVDEVVRLLGQPLDFDVGR